MHHGCAETPDLAGYHADVPGVAVAELYSAEHLRLASVVVRDGNVRELCGMTSLILFFPKIFTTITPLYHLRKNTWPGMSGVSEWCGPTRLLLLTHEAWGQQRSPPQLCTIQDPRELKRKGVLRGSGVKCSTV